MEYVDSLPPCSPPFMESELEPLHNDTLTDLPQSFCAHCLVLLSSDSSSHVASYNLKGSPTLTVLQGLLLVFKNRQCQPDDLGKEGVSQQVKLCYACSDKFQTLLQLYLDFIQTAAEDSFVQKLLNKNFPAGDEILPVKVECLLEETEVEDSCNIPDVNQFGQSTTQDKVRRSQRHSTRVKDADVDRDRDTFGANLSHSATDTAESADEGTDEFEGEEEIDSGRHPPSPKKQNPGKTADKVKRRPGRPRKEIKKEPEQGSFACGICCEKFTTQLRLRSHLDRHAGSRPVGCDLCRASFTNFKNLTRHKRQCHPLDPSVMATRRTRQKRNPLEQRLMLAADAELLKTDQYKCEDCAQQSLCFPNFKDWILHQENCHKEVMGYGQVDQMDTVVPSEGLYRPCPQCGKKYKAQRRLIEHIKCVHLHLTEFQCHLCHKVLMSKQSLLHHTSIVHGNQQRMFLCSLCGSSFTSRGGLEVHEKTHRDVDGEGKRFTCDFCGKKYERRHRLKMHIASAHNDARNFICDICGNTFKLATHLNQHKKYTHEKKAIVDEFCSLCGKGYAFKDDLKNHLMATHKLDKEEARIAAKMRQPSIFRVLPNGDRVFKEKPNLKPKTICHICNRSYVRRKQLYLHLISIHNYTEEESQRVTGFESKYLRGHGGYLSCQGPGGSGGCLKGPPKVTHGEGDNGGHANLTVL